MLLFLISITLVKLVCCNVKYNGVVLKHYISILEMYENYISFVIAFKQCTEIKGRTNGVG